MKDRGRFVTLTVVMVLLALAAVLLALRFGWFRSDTAPVILPETTAAIPRGDESGSGDVMTAEVTPETVQAVVGTLVRPDSYARTFTVESFWTGGSQTWNVQVWQKNGAVRVCQQPADGTQETKNILFAGSNVRIWYGDRTREVAAYQIDDPSLRDTLQMLPTYEDVLALAPEEIDAAGYVRQKDAWCIMASAAEAATGYRMVYYISIETGLLEAAERWDGETLLYRMNAIRTDLAAPADYLFILNR